MYCTKCGKALEENVKFCPECGNMIKYQQPHNASRAEDREVPVNSSAAAPMQSPNDRNYKQEQPVRAQPKKVKKKMGKGKKTIITIGVILAVLLAMAITGFCILITSPAYGVWREIKKENYSEALSDYRSDVEDEFIQEIILEILLKEYDNKIFQKYQSGELKYVSAVEALELLDRLGVIGIEEKINNITELENANSAMQQGNQYYASGDYENAIQKYTAITESSDKYTEAQSKLNELYPKYIDAIVEKVKSYSSVQKYVEAIEYIEVSAVLIPANVDTAKLDQIRSECLYEYIVYIRDEVVRLVSEKQFTEAFAVIDAAIAVDDNADFQNGKAMVETKYGEYTVKIAQTYLNNGDYISAAKTLQEALEVIPTNTELSALIVKVEKEYETYCITKADSLMAENKHNDAIVMLTEAKKIITNSTKITSKLEEVKKNKPINLFDTNVLYDGNVFWKVLPSDSISFSMGSKSYNEGFMLGCDHSLFGEGDGYALFDLQGKYSAIVFDVGRTNEYEKQNVTLQIFIEEELVEEYSLSAEAPPKTLKINVKNAQSLKLKITGGSRVKYGFVNVILIP